MAEKKKEVQTAPILAGLNGKVMHDPQGLEKYPTLSSLLHPIWKGPDCVRQSGTMRISLVGGYFIVCVSCPTEQVETRVTLDSLVNLMERVEEAVRYGEHGLRLPGRGPVGAGRAHAGAWDSGFERGELVSW